MKQLVTLLALALLFACDKGGSSEGDSKQSSAKQGSAEVAKAKGAAAAAPETATIADVLTEYEKLRADLAADKLDGIQGGASQLKLQADAAARADVAHRKELKAISQAAEQLKGQSKDNPDEMRKVFGEISRHVVSLLSSDEKLREGKHVFECPMAQGFKRWVQPTEKLENPYMGQKMLECGSKVDWGS